MIAVLFLMSRVLTRGLKLSPVERRSLRTLERATCSNGHAHSRSSRLNLETWTFMNFLQLENKSILVMGVANRKSVAWHIARVLTEAGADVLYAVRSEARRESLA